MPSDPSPGELRDLTIVGAGPVGMTAAFWAGMREASVHLVDALGQVGGQLTALYPDKWIYDVPGRPRVRARDLVESLHEQAIAPFDVRVHLDCVAEQVAWEDDGTLTLQTSTGPVRSRALIIAAGHGAFEARRLPASDVDLAPWEGRGVAYTVSRPSDYAGRSVLVVGGGDSAVDWANELADAGATVHLAHRRDLFRAHEASVTALRGRAERGTVHIHTPFAVAEVLGDERLEGVLLRDAASGQTRRVAVDAVLPQLGFVTKLGPLRDWGLTLAGSAVHVDARMATGLPGVWACGDVTAFDAKIKLIATGFAEAAVAVAQAIHVLRPDTAVQPKYSTNTGVPAARAA